MIQGTKWRSVIRQKAKNFCFSESFYGLQAKTIDISELFCCTIGES